MHPLDRVPPPVLAVAAIVSVQFSNAFARTYFESTGPLGAATLRLIFATALLLLIVRPRVRGWDRRTWLTVVALGLGLGGMNSFIYLAIDAIPIGVAVTVEFLGPLAVALVQVRRWADAAWALLALAGVVLLGFDESAALSWVGLLLAAAAGAFWAAYIVTSSRLGATQNGLHPLAVAMVVAMLVVTPFGAADAAAAVVAQPWLVVLFLLVAAGTSAIPYALEYVALRRMPTRVFGILSSLGPAMAALAGLVVLRQQLGWTQLLALVLVTVASVGVTLTARRTPPAPVLD
ncbi:MAG TPA: EamA family transporter [Rhodoglobus sp.]|nr:EamA family transporter [Rhodoglobus sp.]